MSRAQKGFTSSRHIQEVLINVIESIAYCNYNDIPAFILSLDQSKAFDSVRHNYLLEVYKFFGMGENFINMLNVITTGRNACIILDDNTLSRQFNLETGAPQGNSPSPLQYNFAEQIAIFKLEVDPRLASVFVHHLVPRNALIPAEGGPLGGVDLVHNQVQNYLPAPPPPAVTIHRTETLKMFRYESDRQTDKVESFADDKNCIFRASRDALIAVSEILRDFGIFSGLVCNHNKSVLMPVGIRGEPPDYLGEFNFRVDNKIKLLGMEIHSNLSNLPSLHELTIINVRNTANFWSRFPLSLPGRVSIAKTMLLSQINYMGCIISPTPPQLKILQNIVDSFTKGKLNIGRDRVTTPAEFGGLNMVNLKEFIIAQQVNWFKKAAHSSRDNWRVDLRKLGNGNCFSINPEIVDRALHPILKGLAESFQYFSKNFYSLNDNVDSSHLLNNPIVRRSHRDNTLIDPPYFRQNIPELNIESLAKLKLSDICSNGRIKTLDEINNSTGLQFSLVTYMRLDASIYQFYSNRRVPRISNLKSASVAEFFGSFKKGSKQIRRIFMQLRTIRSNPENINCTRTFSDLINCDFGNCENIKRCLNLWTSHFLSNPHREFIFKFYNNSLGLNSRVAHFVQNYNPGCTFCKASHRINPPVESFVHIFLQCIDTSSMADILFDEYIPELVINSDTEKKQFLFYGINHTSGNNDNPILLLIASTFMYTVWHFKLAKRTPTRGPFLCKFFLHFMTFLLVVGN